jgi:hypothetical protein
MKNSRENRTSSSRNLAPVTPKSTTINRRSFLHAAGAAAALGTLGAPVVMRSAAA